jgi:hypothetical protein
MAFIPARLTDLIRRELGEVRVVLVEPSAEGGAAGEIEGDDEGSAAAQILVVALPRGYALRLQVADPNADRGALQARLDAIVSSFWASLSDALPPATRPPVSEALQRELRALAAAAGAIDAVVIDAMSRVTWVAAAATDAEPRVEHPLAQVISIDRSAPPATSSAPDASPTERAVDCVRALADMATLHKGGSLAHHDRDAAAPWIARSFATIYVLVLVFDAPFDELLAERGLHARLPAIERFVLALPPLDPTPHRNTNAARAPRR